MPSGNYLIQLRLGGERVNHRPHYKGVQGKTALVKSQHKVNQPKQKRATKPLTVGKTIDKYISGKSNTLSTSTIRGYDAIHRTHFHNVMADFYNSFR